MKKALALLALAVLVSGCAAVGEAFGIKAATEARQIIIDPGFATTKQVIRMAEPVLRDAAADGAVVEMWIVTSGVAASMVPIDLEGANQGDFRPNGRNAHAWTAEAEANTAAAIEAVGAALAQHSNDGTGADLFGAIAIAASRVQGLDGTGIPAVFLITGGGVHRTAQLDLVHVDYANVDAASLVDPLTPLDVSTVSITVIGAGRFPSVTPPPDPKWAAGVHATWEAFCASAGTDECSVRDAQPSQKG